MQKKILSVYLSGEIHSTWREDIKTAVQNREIPVRLMGPEIDHETSDACGAKVFGPEDNKFWYDHRSARLNTIRSKFTLEAADMVVVKFGDKYRQWNAAFDAGKAISQGKPLITFHDTALDHPLKEINAEALATARSVEHVVEILAYVTSRPF